MLFDEFALPVDAAQWADGAAPQPAAAQDTAAAMHQAWPTLVLPTTATSNPLLTLRPHSEQGGPLVEREEEIVRGGLRSSDCVRDDEDIPRVRVLKPHAHIHPVPENVMLRYVNARYAMAISRMRQQPADPPDRPGPSSREEGKEDKNVENHDEEEDDEEEDDDV